MKASKLLDIFLFLFQANDISKFAKYFLVMTIDHLPCGLSNPPSTINSEQATKRREKPGSNCRTSSIAGYHK